MKRNIFIQLKAAFLLLVFGLNTMVGFACAMGVDMRFNSTHHHSDEAIKVHVHSDGKLHQHKAKPHGRLNKHKDEKENCCNDAVVKFSQADKAVPQANTNIDPVFFSALIASWYNIDISYPSQIAGSIRYFVRSYHPPIPDIRIAIQSFQI